MHWISQSLAVEEGAGRTVASDAEGVVVVAAVGMPAGPVAVAVAVAVAAPAAAPPPPPPAPATVLLTDAA